MRTETSMTVRLYNPTSDLLVRTAAIDPGNHVLLLHSDDPELARWVVEQAGDAGQVTALHTSYRALSLLAEVAGLDLSDNVYPDPKIHAPASVALLDIPKGREVARAYLWTAAQVLRPDGRLYIAGSNALGAKSVIKDAADLFGDVPVLGFRSSRRIALATRGDGLPSNPADWFDEVPWQPQMRSFRRPEGQYMIVTMPGVFSWDHLDEGTALLLDHLDVEPDSDVLDMGCGYGIIGLVAARAGARVTMVDDDLLAVRCASASIEVNNFGLRCRALASDLTIEVRDQQFDLVLSNPPFHQGVDVTTGIATQMIREIPDVLRPGGRLRIVANRFLPYHREMRAVFGNVSTITETGRYIVLESVWEG
jgi:16S rRNA (guanine1207-N2)-methyltransferase